MALVAADPAIAASQVISSGTATYPAPGYGSNDSYAISGATTKFVIEADSDTLINTIDVNGGATVDNSGTIHRTGSGNRGIVGGDGTLINRAPGVIISDDGTGVLFYDGGEVLNDGGRISGGVYGISLQGAPGTVTNQAGGEIDGLVIVWEGGAIANDGAGTVIDGGASLLGAGGTIDNTGGATILADGRAVHLRGGGTVTNSGDGSLIEGDTAAYLEDGGTLDNGAGATVRGQSNGVLSDGEASVTNAGTIEATDGDAIDVAGGMVTNTGTGASIVATGTGVWMNGFGDVINADGASISGDTGVNMYWGGDVTNSGAAHIEATGYGIVVWDEGTVVNTGDGSLISGDRVGIDFTPYATPGPFLLRNEAGADVVGGYAGVRFWDDGSGTPHDGGHVENRGAGSSISAESYAVFFEEGAIGDVLNEDDALIEGLLGSGVVFYSGGGVVNRTGADITGKVVGVYALGGSTTIDNSGAGSTIHGEAQGAFIDPEAGGNGTITNSGGATISGGTYAGGGTAIWITRDGSVTNDAATIRSATANGVSINGAATVVNRNGGTIEGATAAISIEGAATVENLTGSTLTGSVFLGSGGTLTNSGTSRITGPVVAEGNLELANNGASTIAGGVSADTGEITNDAATIGTAGDGIGVLLNNGGDVSNVNGGRIQGGDIAIYLYDGGGTVTNGAGSVIASTSTGIHAFGDTTVTNAGTIEGNVWLEDGATNIVTLMTGSRITGDLYIGSSSASRLILDGSGTQLYSDAVINDTVFASTVVKKGSGTWTIDKQIDAQVFNIDEGHLILGVGGAGAVTATIYANPGTVISGSGTLYGNLITDGATVAPGNSPGTLTIVGGYLQDAASVYELEFDRAANITDQLLVRESSSGAGDGNAILQAGTKLNVTQLGAGQVTLGARYAVLSADTALSGTFDLTGDLVLSPFLALTDDYDARHAYLVVQQTRSLTDVAATPNQGAIAAALESAGSGNAALSAVLSQTGEAEARLALDQLAGTSHPALRAGLLASSRQVREAPLEHLRAALCARTGSCEPGANLWTSGYAEDAVGAETRIANAGWLAGADLPGPAGTRFGVYGGVVSTALAGTVAPGAALGTYGAAAMGPVELRWGASTTTHAVASSRAVSFPGYSATLTASYAALQTQVFGEAGYRLEAGPMAIEPFGGLALAGISTGAFAEAGGDAALSGAAGYSGELISTLGVALDTAIANGRVRGRAGWQHIAGGESASVVTFAGGTTAARISAAALPADSAFAGVSFDLPLGEAAQLSMDYDAILAPGTFSHAFRAELSGHF